MEKSILIVEDNEHLRIILAKIVQVFGFQTILAQTGAEAIEKTIVAKPDLIFLDLDLPDIGGHDVARKITKNPAYGHIPIIGCSAYNEWDEKERALEAGMVDYLQKPISSVRFKEAIERFI